MMTAKNANAVRLLCRRNYANPANAGDSLEDAMANRGELDYATRGR
jgi:hypothetical protein